jgi:excisionase family DNA binding protein
MKKFLTTKQIANEYGVSISFIYKATSRREIPHYKIGGKLLFLREEIEKMILDSKIESTEDCDLSINLKR